VGDDVGVEADEAGLGVQRHVQHEMSLQPMIGFGPARIVSKSIRSR
jgi:hypothetical protein